jgi:hypothetical protein
MKLIEGLGWWVFFNLLTVALIVVCTVVQDAWRTLRGRLVARALIRSAERVR